MHSIWLVNCLLVFITTNMRLICVELCNCMSLQTLCNILSNTDLAQFEGAESNIISQLISAAENVENLCRMDPAWNAWI